MEVIDENPDDIQWEGVYCSLFLEPTDSVDNGGVISILSDSEYSPIKKNNNEATVIGYLE